MIPRVRLQDEARRRPSEVFRKAAGSSPHASRASRHGDMALIAVFLVLICLPLSGLILGFDRTFVLEENRNLAARPALEARSRDARRVPGQARGLLQRPFRLPQTAHLLARAREGARPGGDLDARRHARAQTAGCTSPATSAVSSYRATRPFTPEQLEAYRQILEARRDWLAARGIPYLLVIPPNKDTIYPEFMPAAYNKLHPRSRLDQLLDYMRDAFKRIDPGRPGRPAASQAGRAGL